MPKLKYRKVEVNGEEALEPFSGYVSDAIVDLIEMAKKEQRNINLCFNGTVVTVAPGSNGEEVYANWTRMRASQQNK